MINTLLLHRLDFEPIFLVDKIAEVIHKDGHECFLKMWGQPGNMRGDQHIFQCP